jgi:hypothetical protein
MWLTVLVLIVGLAPQIACAYVSHRILERWAPNYDGRSCYLVSLLCGSVIVGIPCAVAAVFGLLLPTTVAWIYGGGLALFGLGLLFNSGNLAESGVVAFLIIWIVVFMLPTVHWARERALQQQRLHAPRATEPTK